MYSVLQILQTSKYYKLPNITTFKKIFSDSTVMFNPNSLVTPAREAMLKLNGGKELKGITHSTLFVSASGSMFSWHCEEQDMGSLNYLHRPNRSIKEFKDMPVTEKVWYIVPPGEFHLFEEVANGLLQAFKKGYKCQNWIMHRFLMLSPETLNKFGINTYYTRQQEGEYVLVYPSTYHSGKQFSFFKTIQTCHYFLPNITGYNTAIGVASACAWVSEEFWFPHAVHARSCDPQCTNPTDEKGKKLKPTKKVFSYDMKPLFLERNATNYVQIWDARKAMTNGHKEYVREDTLTYQNMTKDQLELLNNIEDKIKDLLPSK